MADVTEPETRGPGRPPDYQLEFCKVAHEMAQAGATDFEIAKALEIHESTFYRWQSRYPEFREALKLGKEASDDRVERSLYHRAVGYSYQSVKIMQDKGSPVIVPFIEHVPPDPGAATMWLTNRRSDKWKAKQAVAVTDPNGEALTVNVRLIKPNATA